MISISAYGAKAKTDSTKISTGGASSSSSGGSFTPVNLWGQYFDDTQDIDGDMTVNGTIRADRIVTQNMDAGNMSVDNLDVNERLTAQAALVQDLEADALKADRAELANALINELAAGNLVTNNLTVTQGAYFFELVIDKIKSAGGAIILSPADGFKIDKVVDNGNSKTLYFRSEDGSKKIHNMWQRGDQAISQNFNNAKVGKSYNVSNKFWWALVTDTNNDSNNGEPVSVNFGTQDSPDNKLCHYITVSTEQNEFIGDVSPEVDEDVAMLGSRVEGRQSAQYLAAYASLDIDLKAPLFAQYQGINDFDLASHKITWFSSGVTAAGEVKGLLQNEITGSFRTSSGKTMEDLIEEAAQGTTYRLIVNPAAIKVNSNGNVVTPSTLTMTILESSGGEVTEYNTVPNFLKVELYGVSGSNESKIFTRDSSNSSLSFSTSGLGEYDYCYAKLLSSTTYTTYDKVSITKNTDASVEIQGDVTEIDRLIDNGSLAKVFYDTSDNSYKLDFYINVSVYHSGKEDSYVVNPQNGITNFSVQWEWNKKNGNGDSAQGTISAPPSSTAFIYQPSSSIPYSTDSNSNDCKSYLKLKLIKGGNIIDTLIIHVTMKAEAIFEVVQGTRAHIASIVSETIQNEYNNWVNSSSQITQFAENITLRVETLENNMEGVTGNYESIISQTASEILAQVSDGLSTTGIDIVNHIINLNADNTNINGSLNIYGAYGTGFKVWNDVQGSATKSVQITNINLGIVQSYVMTNILNNSNIESANVIGMDGAAFTPNYNQMLWWGKSNSDSKYEFIVRNKLQNFRIREEGIQRTVYSGQIWTDGNKTIDASNMSSYSTLGKTLLNSNIDNEFYWQDISSTLPVLTFMGDIDLTTDGQGHAGPFPDVNFRRYGIFVCVESYGRDRTMHIPHPTNCPGRTIFVKNRGGANLRIYIHGNENVFMSADSADKYPYMEIGYLSTVFVSDGNYWIQFYCG